ncbi:MAG: WcaF family extracellular polysaccharide biosynthesis acetyltransferase [Aquaticitalea sp.]
MKTDLSTYNNSWYNPGSKLKCILWYFVNIFFFRSPLVPVSSVKRSLLRLFGAKIGNGVVIKPRVNIKYPWFLSIDDNTWVGEDVWIDNVAQVTIGKNVCLSQGAMILCGSHDYSKSSFDLIIGPITLEDGVWIGAQAVVPLGITCKSHSILSLKSVATKTLEPYYIYQGNPAKEVRLRVIT